MVLVETIGIQELQWVGKREPKKRQGELESDIVSPDHIGIC
jgi:hypothetical protein